MKKDSFNLVMTLIFLIGIGVLIYSVFILLPNINKPLTEVEQQEAIKTKQLLDEFLKTLDLSLGEDKTKITHLKDGFIFLGVHFIGKNRFVDNERLQKSISNLHHIAKTKLGFKAY